MNRRVISANPYLGGASNGYAHPSGTALHYDDVPCVNGSVSAPCLQGERRPGLGQRGRAFLGLAPPVSVQMRGARELRPLSPVLVSDKPVV